MPIYEYTCGDCGKEFEALVSRVANASCPACAGTRLERRLSVFAVGATAGPPFASASPAPCGTCGDPRGPGSCRVS